LAPAHNQIFWYNWCSDGKKIGSEKGRDNTRRKVSKSQEKNSLTILLGDREEERDALVVRGTGTLYVTGFGEAASSIWEGTLGCIENDWGRDKGCRVEKGNTKQANNNPIIEGGGGGGKDQPKKSL